MYFVKQDDFINISAYYLLEFLFYIVLTVKLIKYSKLEIALWLGLIIRIIALFASPQLSDDIYRYYWDGKLFIEGINPFQYAPLQAQAKFQFSDPSLKEALEKMNSSEYMTVYPSFCQLLFGISAFLSFGSKMSFSIILKLPILLIELIIVKKLFLKKSVDAKMKTVFVLYFLNPLIIVETYGNLHFELIMGLLFILSIFHLVQEKYFQSWTAYGLSVITKIYSLILIPIFLMKGQFRGLQWIWVFILILLTQVLFIGIDFQNIEGYRLYFKQFEFNSSLFILFSKLLIYLEKPELWNYRGLILNFLWIIFASLYLVFNRNKIKEIQGIFEVSYVLYGAFLLCHATLHPWYVITFIMIGFFVYPMTSIWISFIVTLSYIHYHTLLHSYLSIIQCIEYSSILLIYLYERRNPDFYKSRFLKTKPITTLS